MKPESLRRTGRTTRLVYDAIEAAAKGHAVYIVMACHGEIKRVQQLLGTERMHRLGIKIETAESLGAWDWDTLRNRGAHANCVFLVDHHAIEARFSGLLAELHRYDP